MYLEIIYQYEAAPLTDALQKLFIPRKVRHLLRTKRNVLINYQSCPFHTIVQPGDLLSLTFDKEDYPDYRVTPWQTNIDVCYEDEHLIIVNKPCHIKTHPNQPQETETMLNAVKGYFVQHNDDSDPYVVHRLDKETSGLLLFAKNPVILPLLTQMLERKEIHRDYEAMIDGVLNKAITITKNIAQDRHDKRRRIAVNRGGKHAITHVKVIKKEGSTTRVRCTLDTGRTHQIRVHLASINHPILGDPLYNEKDRRSRLYLHAYHLYFNHPLTGEPIDIYSSIPF